MDLYSEIILDHYKNPRNKGELKDPTNVAEESNPLCGDKLKISLKFDKAGKVEKAKFSGEGCAISQAAASMLTEKLIGKTTKEIANLKDKDILKMLNIPISHSRQKCALLALKALKKAI
ncbi:MAG: SUF system NifU family Fe-S cluster assembly protein [Candidatus Gracilibacteria bacterium]|jgi:nitrogen fixation NifU-like protein